MLRSRDPLMDPSVRLQCTLRDHGFPAIMHLPKTQSPMQSLRNLCIRSLINPLPGDPRVLPLIHFPKTQASGPGPLPSHLRMAPPQGRGSGPLPPRPRPQPRCPRTRWGCTASRAPSDSRGGEGSARGRLRPAVFPFSPPTLGWCGRRYVCAVAAREAAAGETE